ncbi:MAG: hypothetical protein H6822_12760 [Planctomycetaceae bacterium]|nr:hypothetical protein [Planctomycetales bacterium]MCB9923048.1 hypothetical protein [Planctomycetaceae bacterium]
MNTLIAAIGPFSLLQIIIAYLIGALICAVGILVESLWEKSQSNARRTATIDAAAHDPLCHTRQLPGRRREVDTAECATHLCSTFYVYNPILDTRTRDRPSLKQPTASHPNSRLPEV